MNQLATDSLLWIKGELDNVMLRARQGLEAYAEDSEDRNALGQCVESLHQVQGTLRIVEVFGAALLAEEMEAVAKEVYSGTLKASDEVFDVLMRAILQLPDYLEHVIEGQRDMPLALLSLLNELRGARNQPLLTESALFARTLGNAGVKLPTAPNVDASKPADLRMLARRLRPKFQSALLAWLKKDTAKQPLKRMLAVTSHFEQASGRPAVFELWWIVGGVLEALLEGGLESSVELKQTFGRIDRQIKRLVRESEMEFANEPPRDLINNLLYYVGRARSGGERVSSIKESFNLTELLPDEARIDETREALSGPNAQLLRTVSAAIREDVIQVKDSLDIFVRTGQQNTDDLAPLAELLKKVGDTLAVLGLDQLRTDLTKQVETLREIVAGSRKADETQLSSVADSLLKLEARLDSDIATLLHGGDAPLQAKAEPEDGGDGEYKNTFGAVIRESIINLARVKDAMTEYSRDGKNRKVVEPVPGHIRQVQAGLGLLSMERPASILGGICRFVERAVLTGGSVPSPEALDRMADALVSVEFYLETVQSGRGDPQSMLDNAETCVAQLDVDAEEGTPSLSVVQTPPANGEIEAVSISSIPSAPEVAQKSAPTSGPQPDEVDPEILEIFLEEAQEELATLRDYFPRWQRNLEDHDALAVVRRSFHTLKGSGRMVGARRIGEFSWAIENMLNRVIDCTVEVNDPIVNLVAQVLDALPELVEELKTGARSNVDVDGLVERADAFSRGERPDPHTTASGSAEGQTLIETAAEAGSETLTQTNVDADSVPESDVQPNSAVENDSVADEAAMDPALYEIFSKESAAHLTVLETFITDCEQGSAGLVDETVLRTLHTLKGSAHMAGVDIISELVEPAERYLKSVSERQAMLPSPAVSTLRNTTTAIRMIVEGLADGGGGVERDFSELKRQLDALSEEGAGRGDDLGDSSIELEESVVDEAPEATDTSDADDKASADIISKEIDFSSLAQSAGKVPEETSEPTDFDPELAAIFFEEARELIESIDSGMQQWTDNPHDGEVVAELQRYLHTFKGGARMAGLMPLGDLSHELETLLTPVADGRLRVSQQLLRVVQQVVDRLHQMLESCIAGAVPQAAIDLLDMLAWIQQRGGDWEDEKYVPGTSTTQSAASKTKEQEVETPADFRPESESAERRQGNRVQADIMRVRADLLESALNHAGEVGIYRSRLEQHNSNLNFNIAEFDSTVARLRDQLRNFEIETEAQIVFQHEQESGDERGDFDPLELDRYSQLQQLSRALMESVGDLVSIHSLLDVQAREAETLLLQQSRVTTELQDSLMRTRMIPFSNHAHRLRRVVRQAATESGKDAELKLSGAEGEMDRQVLERVLAPLEHMLRNAVVHGIESAKERKKLKKPATGQITIDLHREGAEVVINILDDGAGLNIAAIREQAVARGLLESDIELPDIEIMQFIFETGFSTAKKVTKSAGRGVGMDVVASEVKQLGGSLIIDSVAGSGTRFTVRLPFTLAITQALMVTAAGETFAVPLPTIEGIARIPGRDLNRYFAGELKEFTYGGREYQLHHLSALLDFSVSQAEEGRTTYPVLLLHSGDQYGALVTESMQGSHEVVVKSIGPQLASIRGLSGATIRGDGSIMLILDPAALMRTAHGRLLETTIVEQPVAAVDNRKLVMVVDDSITVRRVTQRLLERYDMRVETAKDGVDALTQLQDITPDVMLLDIEMPRMDGYELATNIRNDERLRNVPIIMITSRTGDKHRNRAMEIGVNEYLGKPYQEAELLEHIQRLTGAVAA